ncbi:MAG: hypothetical protein WKG07_42875 [Hymenobacter sp.]
MGLAVVPVKALAAALPRQVEFDEEGRCILSRGTTIGSGLYKAGIDRGDQIVMLDGVKITDMASPGRHHAYAYARRPRAGARAQPRRPGAQRASRAHRGHQRAGAGDGRRGQNDRYPRPEGAARRLAGQHGQVI